MIVFFATKNIHQNMLLKKNQNHNKINFQILKIFKEEEEDVVEEEEVEEVEVVELVGEEEDKDNIKIDQNNIS